MQHNYESGTKFVGVFQKDSELSDWFSRTSMLLFLIVFVDLYVAEATLQ